MQILGLFQRDPSAKADEAYNAGEKEKAAELYTKANKHEQAGDVYAELNHIDQAVDSYLKADLPLKAGELLDRQDRSRDAITLFEKAGAFRQAAESALKAKNTTRAGRLFEQASMFRQAADSYTTAGDHERALQSWEKEVERLRDNEGEAATAEILEIDMLRSEILQNLHRYGEAAEVLETHNHERAAKLFMRDRKYERAAKVFLNFNQITQAIKAIDLSDSEDFELRAEIYSRGNRHAEAGELYVKLGQLEAAAEAFERGGVWARAAELWEKCDNPGLAGEHFLRVERFADAARCFSDSGRHFAAADAYAKAFLYADAGEAYLKADRPLEAGNAFLTVGMTDRAFEILQEIGSDEPDYTEASLLLIPLLLDQHIVEGAEMRLDVLKNANLEPAYRRYYWEGRISEAKGRFREAEQAYQKVMGEKRNFADAHERFEDLRGKLSGPISGSHPMEELTGSIPIAAPESPETVLSGPGMLEATMPGLTPSTAPNLEGLPFVIREEIEPWWPGVGIYKAVDRRRKAEILLIAFPKIFVPWEPSLLRHTMGKYTGIGLGAVLQLHELVLANEHVLLLHDAFEGAPLGQLLGEEGSLTPMAALNVLQQICFALKEGQKVGITHQWLSPRTVLIDKEQKVKLVGLGLRDCLAKHDHTARAYLSPETREGGDGSPASDVYSIGLLGLELLQAFLPAGWDGSEDLDGDEVGWPSEAEDQVPQGVRKLLIRSLSIDPMRRPSAEQLYSELVSVGLVSGQVLADRYEVGEEIGRGGMSRVYRAKDRQFSEEVAIKTMINLAADSTEERDRLFREVQICRKISHPNVVRVHDFGEYPGGVFIIMEYLDGPDLDVVIDDEAPLPLERVRRFMLEITAALGEAHRLKVVHRDLKPANVMLVNDRIKVMDFGIAHMDDRQSKQLTRAGEVVGSPLYMAPEQIQGKPLNGTCDLYALGVMSYKLLTGIEPFEADTATAVVFKHIHEKPPDILKYRENLPHAWVDLLAKLLAKDPDERYQSADELTQALHGLPI